MHPFVARFRTVVPCAATLAAGVLLAGAAGAQASTDTTGCPAIATTQAFAAWQDSADYFLAPNGGFEAGTAGWSLDGGAAAVAGNQPFAAGGSALGLPAGSSATTATICVGAEHRTMRFFANAAPGAKLRVEVSYAKRGGAQKSVKLGTVNGTGAWAPTDVLPMVVNEIAGDFDNALPVTLRFAPQGGSSWTIDDVYVDPFKKS